MAHFPLPSSLELKGKKQERAGNLASEDILLPNILIDFRSSSKGCSLADTWNTSLINQKIPLNKIKNYFGEKSHCILNSYASFRLVCWFLVF